MNARVRRPAGRQRRQPRPRPSLFYFRDRVSKCKSNRVPSVARGGEEEELRFARVETVVPLEHGNYCFTEVERGMWRRKGREGAEREKGKREEVNQFESPSSDPAARERSVSEIAPYSFGYGLIRYTESEKSPAKSHVRAHGMTTARDLPRREIFRGFRRSSVYCTISSLRAGARPSPKLTRAIKITSRYVSDDAKETELEAEDREGKDNHELRGGRNGREMREYFFSHLLGMFLSENRYIRILNKRRKHKNIACN